MKKRELVLGGVLLGLLIYSGTYVSKYELFHSTDYDNQSCSIVSLDNEEWGVVDKNYDWVVEAKFSEIQEYSNGLAGATLDGENWGYIDKRGQWVIEPRNTFKEVYPFNSKEVATVVNAEEEKAQIDKNGTIITPFQEDFSYISSYSENNLALIKTKEDYLGFANVNGLIIIKPEYRYAESFTSNSLALVRNEGNMKYGYINENNESIIASVFSNARSFSDNGLAAVMDNGDYWGYIDSNGEWVIEAQYDSADSFDSNGLAFVRLKNASGKLEQGYINENGEWELVKIQ